MNKGSWHSRALRVVAVGAACLAFAAAAQAPAELRVALVIGNAAYTAAPLVNPVNDAKVMSDALKGLGFSVVEVRDAKKADMERAIAQVREALKDRRGVGLLYYAGHGLQLDWRNYMVPVDARLANADDVRRQAMDVQQVIDAFRAAGNRMNIVVLDACRDNPFAASAGAKGLAQMDAPPGTLLAFATAPGNVALDGTAASGNGLYTHYLARELRQPGTKIEDVFKRVRLQVRKDSQGRQVPWESTSLEDDFFFDARARATGTADPEALEAALQREWADWNRIRASTDPEAFYAYLQKYPTGYITEQAQFRLDQLQAVRVVAQLGSAEPKALPSGVNRYRVGDRWAMEFTDVLTGEVRRTGYRVTHADDHRVEVNDGGTVLDQMGSVLKNRYGEKEPGVMIAPADLSVGKRWRSAFTNRREGQNPSTNFHDFRVVSIEAVTVPAGTYRAFKVVSTGQARSLRGDITFMEGVAWIDPATMMRVRSENKFTRNGKVVEHDAWRLMSPKRAGDGRSTGVSQKE